MIWIESLMFALSTVLYTVSLSECATCYHTVGPNSTTCEISPEQNQYCSIECERYVSHHLCTAECVYDGLDCHNETTANFVLLCCNTSYCNTFNGFLTTTNVVSNTPIPTTFPNDDDDDDNDVTIHIIIAVCLSVVVILAVMALVITLIICHWRRWNRDQFRWRNIIN